MPHRFLTLIHGEPRWPIVRSYGAPLYEIVHSELAFGFICALVLIVNSLARRSTYDFAPECMTPYYVLMGLSLYMNPCTLYITMTPL